MHVWRRTWTGPVRAVVFDWAGTTVDHGSLAPVGVFVELFRRRGVEVSLAEAREPMGVHKREHIRRVTVMPRVAAAWRAVHGRDVTDDDVDAMYEEATPAQIAVLADHCDPIAGVLPAVARLRARGIRIGSTTGYNRPMLDVLEPLAAAKGWRPDVALAASEVAAGRPEPFLNWRAAERLGMGEPAACVAVGDTIVDVEAGIAAGFWTIGVAATGNLVGLSERDLAALPATERTARIEAARATLFRAGAHLVVDGVAQIEPAIDELEARLRRGERP
jgi:phosphonoacetaldehyde hydrolase